MFFDLGTWANLAQILSVIVPALAFSVAYRHKNCHVPWCPRIGQHPVEGTAFKVCTRHHTRKTHLRMKAIHDFYHSDRLAHGESHVQE